MPEPLLTPEFMESLDRLSLVSRKVFAGRMKGERRSKNRGSSVEFADFRDYAQGDDPRFIDWNSYGRLERLYIKLFMEEEDLFVYLLVDTSASMGFGRPPKLRFAQRLAAALGYVSLIGMDRVALGTFDRGLGAVMAPSRGKGQTRKFLAFLEGLEARGQTDLETAARLFLLRFRRPGMLILVSDFLDKGGYERALATLAARRLEIGCVQVLSPEEEDPRLAGDLRLEDVEDGSATEITVTERLLRSYRGAVDGYAQGLAEFCLRRGISFVRCSSASSVEETVLRTFRGIGVVK